MNFVVEGILFMHMSADADIIPKVFVAGQLRRKGNEESAKITALLY